MTPSPLPPGPSAPGVGFTVDVAVGAAGTVYVSDAANHVVQVYDPTGAHLMTIGGFGPEPLEFIETDALATDGEGHLYVVDFGNRRVQKVSIGALLDTGGTPVA